VRIENRERMISCDAIEKNWEGLEKDNFYKKKE